MGDGGMFAYDEFRPAIGLLREVWRWPKRKTGDPIAASNRRVCLQMQEIDVLANGEMTNATAFLHDQSRWTNAGEADPAAWVNFVVELFFQKRAPHPPGEKQAQEHENFFHNCAPRLR
jgi:hypothetical protein